MTYRIPSNCQFYWLDQVIHNVTLSEAPSERTNRLVFEVGLRLTSIEFFPELQSVEGLKQFSQALHERNPEAARRTQGLVDDLTGRILGKEGAELALAIRMKDTDGVLELAHLPKTSSGKLRVARAILETGSQVFSPDLINLLRDISPEDLALLIHTSQVPIQLLFEILGKQQEDTLLTLAPHLSYADFRGLGKELQKKLLDNCSPGKLNHLFIKSVTLVALPAGMAALQHLACTDCQSLTALPEGMTALKSLNCGWCSSLEKLPEDMASLQSLKCTSCNSLTSLPEGMAALKSLICGNCVALTKLPGGMAALQYLDCSLCELEMLPEDMASLQILTCSWCTRLESLPEGMAALQSLDCGMCMSLRKLPEGMAALQSLKCTDCTGLASLPEGMAALQSLECSGCSNLTRLPEDMTTLKILYCSWCARLASLPVALPQCTLLTFFHCPYLRNTPTPEMPANAQVYRDVANNHHQQYSWSVPYIEIPNDPKGFLCLLGERWLIKGFPFPSIAYKEENGKAFQGIDFGGVRRDFVSRIITHLFDGMLEPGNSLKRSVDGFPLWQDEDEKQATAYLSLARLMALCYQHVCNLTTGPMFSPRLYQALLSDAESLDRAAALLDLEPDLIQLAMDVDSTFPKELSDSVKASVLQYLDPNEDNFKSDCYEQRINMAMEHLKQYRDSLLAGIQDEMFSEKCNWNQINQVIDHLQGELKVALGEQTWEEIKKKGAAHLQKGIEGELSAEALWAHLDWDYGKSSQAEIEQTKAYFKHWILNASYQELQDFVRAVTGNRALTPKRPTIQLCRRGPDYLPIAHSCPSKLEVSSQLPDQATFDKKMEQFLAHVLAGSGFQMA